MPTLSVIELNVTLCTFDLLLLEQEQPICASQKHNLICFSAQNSDFLKLLSSDLRFWIKIKTFKTIDKWYYIACNWTNSEKRFKKS